MKRDLCTTAIVALAAILLTWLVLAYVERNPWMLVGLAAVLLAVAAIVRAIRGTLSPRGQGAALVDQCPRERQPAGLREPQDLERPSP